MSIHDIVHDINPSFQCDDLQTRRQRETERGIMCCNEQERRKTFPQSSAHSFKNIWQTHPRLHAQTCARRRTKTPKAHSSQMQYISNSVFNGYSSEGSLWCPSNFLHVCVGDCVYLCVCVCHGTDAALSCGRYANERWRCWDLKAAAQLSRADNALTPRHLHLSWHNTLLLPATAQADTHTKQASRAKESHTNFPHTNADTHRRIHSLLECSPCTRLTKKPPRILIS